MAREKKPKYAVGFAPTVNLLSNEHLAKRETAATRKRGLKFVGGVLAVTLLVAAIPASMGAVKFFELSGVVTQVSDLKLQQAQYSGILDKQNAVSGLEAARISIVANEIDWATFLEGVNGALGQDAALTNLSMTAAEAPAGDSAEAAAAAAPGGAQSFVFAAALNVGDLNGLEAIKNRFKELPGAVSISFATASGGADAGAYQVSSTMTFNQDILWGRFKPKPAEVPAPADPGTAAAPTETGE